MRAVVLTSERSLRLLASSHRKWSKRIFQHPHRQTVTRHHHGNTGLCGVAWYDADHFPKEYVGCMFLGNVVTNKVNLDRIESLGCTTVAKELPNFLTSSDPCFRPTDIKLGPDVALYCI